MMHLPTLTALVFALDCLGFVIGLDCTNRCCYYYNAIPKNVITIPCNTEGMNIDLECQIYTPHCDYTNVSVQWYKATTETTTAVTAQGELLSEMSGKYSFSMNQATSAVNNSQNVTNELFLDIFNITIHNFNSSTDDGYYWCQIVINDSCPLQPSSAGHIAFGHYPERKLLQCEYNMHDFIEYEVPPVCAEGTPCMENKLTEQQTTMVYGEIMTSIDSSLGQSITEMNLILYGLIGGLLFIIVLLLLIIVTCTVCNVRNRKTITAMRANKAKYHPGQSLNVYDNQPTKSDDEVFAMDAPEAKETSDRKPHCRKQPILPPSKCAPQTTQEPTTPTMNTLTSRNDEVKYAQPGAMHWPPMIPQEVSSPSQYQGLRASGVDTIAAYNIPHVRRHEYSGGEIKADLKYANLPM